MFAYSPNRNHSCVPDILGDFSGTLLSDGYAAYERYTQNRKDVTHAQCWSHARHYFETALKAEPQAVEAALALIGALYVHEKTIKTRKLSGTKKLAYRTKHSEPIVKSFWHWCEQQCQRSDLLPSEDLATALKYVMNRQRSLQVFLSDSDVPLDTNHLERALRPIPMGRRSWLFCWTEVGAKQVGIIQSLIVTCKLQEVDPYTYLVDVTQRVSQHPASRVIELTPRVWKNKFADNPLRSDLKVLGQ